MHPYRLIQTFFVIASACLISSQASACRVGGVQQLFLERPSSEVPPGTEVIRVRFSNSHPPDDRWPVYVSSPESDPSGISYVGVAQIIGEESTETEAFPVYAAVTSCSEFWARPAGDQRSLIEGDYYLIGRFNFEGRDRRFYAGGLRSHHGEPIYAGWHF